MTDEQIRAAIAEACGWRFHPDGCGYVPPGGNEWIGRGYKSLAECVPDYLNDLNAMHEVENGLGAYEDAYAEELIQVCDRDENDRVGSFHIINSTARQRAEAFLRTLVKWTE